MAPFASPRRYGSLLGPLKDWNSLVNSYHPCHTTGWMDVRRLILKSGEDGRGKYSNQSMNDNRADLHLFAFF